MKNFVRNLMLFPAVKEFENLLRIDKVIAMSLVYYTVFQKHQAP